MRVVFMGTPDFAVPSLKALLEAGHKVAAVFTQPDRPAGRGKDLRPSPVKEAAQSLNLKVLQPERVKAVDAVQALRALKPECIVVVAYGQILSQEILSLPHWGCINVHASLLPAYRGAAPIHWAIMRGEPVAGVTTMQMDAGLDTGAMLLKAEYPIGAADTTGEVQDALAALGARLLVETLAGLEKGEVKPVPQAGLSSYASLLTREHERIQWQKRAGDIHNQVRGLNPWPGAYTTFKGETIKIWKTRFLEANTADTGTPGQVLRIEDDGITVATGGGLVKLLEVQPAGKRRMAASDFFRGRHGSVGQGFE